MLALLFLYCYLSIWKLMEKGRRNGLNTAHWGTRRVNFLFDWTELWKWMVQQLSVVLQIGLITSVDQMTCNYQYLWISSYLLLSNWEKSLAATDIEKDMEKCLKNLFVLWIVLAKTNIFLYFILFFFRSPNQIITKISPILLTTVK